MTLLHKPYPEFEAVRMEVRYALDREDQARHGFWLSGQKEEFALRFEAYTRHRWFMRDTEHLRKALVRALATPLGTYCIAIHADGDHTVIDDGLSPEQREIRKTLEAEIALVAARYGLSYTTEMPHLTEAAQ